ncbi:MAG: metallophosphoesterase [Myxococcota bacterium]
MSLRPWILPLIFLLGFAAGCQPESAPTPTDEPTSEPEAEKPNLEDEDVEEPKPAEPTASTKACVGPIEDGEPVKVKIGKQMWERRGSTLSATKGLKKKKLVVGTLSDVKEDSEENLANLDVLVKKFKKAKVDLVMVAGDSGLDQKQIVGVLNKIAGIGVPVFAIAGNREGEADYTAALTEVTQANPNVLSLNEIRRIDTPFADFVSLPGYFNPNYIHAEDGCQYFQADVDQLDELAKASDSPVVLISHGGPKQSGEEGIDRTAEGDNVGDPMLLAAIEKNKIPFGIFGNIHEAGGRATDLEGTKVLAEGKSFDSMYLNPGPADGVAWQMNDGSESIGMGAVFTIDADGKATYAMHRIPDPSKKVAKKP